MRESVRLACAMVPSACLKTWGAWYLGAVRAREIGLEAKVKACTFTCHGSTWRCRHYDTGEEYVQIAQGITLHGDRLDGALDVTNDDAAIRGMLFFTAT